jgi:hypothetical protein
MEKLYRKLPNGKYESVGYNLPDVPEGFYFKQNTKHGSRLTSINYWLGSSPKEPVDLNTLVNIMSLDNDLADYLGKVEDEKSQEFKQLKEESGFIKGSLKLYNISRQDLALIVLRWIYNKTQTS